MTRSLRRQSARRASSRGFTLLEVMVAVAILGLGLVVILTAQTGLFSSAKRAATMSTAVGLARCKMSEVEEELLREGFQITDEQEEGPCCEDEESELRCKWTIATVLLPELSAGGGADAGAAPEEEPATSALDALSAAKDDLGSGDTQGAFSGLADVLGGAPSAGPSMGAGALAPLAMGLIYPNLKTMLEASIRKVTVQVLWSEGSVERDLSVTQYITNPQQGGLLTVDESLPSGAGGGTSTGTSGAPPGNGAPPGQNSPRGGAGR
jgi:general secretion pathway protein I